MSKLKVDNFYQFFVYLIYLYHLSFLHKKIWNVNFIIYTPYYTWSCKTQKNQLFLVDLIINIALVRRFYLMEQVRRIELPSQPWQGYILTIEPHLQRTFIISNFFYNIKSFNEKISLLRKF